MVAAGAAAVLAGPGIVGHESSLVAIRLTVLANFGGRVVEGVPPGIVRLIFDRLVVVTRAFGSLFIRALLGIELVAAGAAAVLAGPGIVGHESSLVAIRLTVLANFGSRVVAVLAGVSVVGRSAGGRVVASDAAVGVFGEQVQNAIHKQTLISERKGVGSARIPRNSPRKNTNSFICRKQLEVLS